MKKMIKMFLVMFILLAGGVFLFVVFFYDSSLKEDLFYEEANPIRDGEIITGMNYIVKIAKNRKDESIILKPSILESINHYKNMDDVSNFLINLTIDNESKYPYLLKDICVIDDRDNSVVKDIDSFKKNNNNQISFELDDEIFKNYRYYHKIRIELER